MHIDPALGVTTDGRTPTLEIAKEQFKSSWSKVRESDEQKCFARVSDLEMGGRHPLLACDRNI